ncbi:MAG: hypothetical protein J2P15_16575 [Micromonosporaceae bacterium]|nr:hypothetical protein [Micromonosporaceae bacterium]
MAAALAAVAVWSTACSTPHPLPSPPKTSNVVESCFGRVPADWATALTGASHRLPSGVAFLIDALAGNTAFGEYKSRTGTGIGRVDVDTGAFTPITTFPPRTGGVGGMAAAYPWLVWEQLDSQTNPSDWSVHAWNQRTGTATVLATSRLADGGYLPGPQPLPVLRNGRAAWAQPLVSRSGPVQFDLHAVDLDTGRQYTVDTGRVSSPVYAGGYLVWGSYADSGGYALRAADATTLQRVPLPSLLGDPGTIGYLGGSSRYLAWSNADSSEVTAWQIGSPDLRRYASHDGRHPFQFLTIAGDFLLWYGGIVSSLLDLRTGRAFDVAGTLAGSPDAIAAGQSADHTSTLANWVSRVPLPAAPAVTTCTA